MGTVDFNYVIVNVLMLIVFIYAGKKVSESEKPWQYIWLCTVAFAFVLGSRYLRGNDYIRYQETFLFDYDSSEVLFTAWPSASSSTFSSFTSRCTMPRA